MPRTIPTTLGGCLNTQVPGALKERARQRGSELKGQIDEGQIADLELWPSAGGVTLVFVHTDSRRRANRNRGSSWVSAFP